MKQNKKEKKAAELKPEFMIGEPISWFDSRYYPVVYKDEDYQLPSVTTILGIVSKGDWLERYRGEIGNREADVRMEEAGDRGSRIHHACVKVATGGAAALCPPWNKAQALTEKELDILKKKHGENIAYLSSQEEMVAVWRFKEWMNRIKPLIIGSELKVFSLMNRYAGALDWAFNLSKGIYSLGRPLTVDKSGVYILDIKSGSESSSHRMQVAAYARAYEGQYQQQVEGGLILYLNGKKPGGLEVSKTVAMSKEELEKEFEYFQHAKAIWERNHKNDSPSIFKYPSVVTMDGK